MFKCSSKLNFCLYADKMFVINWQKSNILYLINMRFNWKFERETESSFENIISIQLVPITNQKTKIYIKIEFITTQWVCFCWKMQIMIRIMSTTQFYTFSNSSKHKLLDGFLSGREGGVWVYTIYERRIYYNKYFATR